MKYYIYSNNDQKVLGYNLFQKEFFHFSKPYKNDSKFIWLFSIYGSKFISDYFNLQDIEIRIWE